MMTLKDAGWLLKTRPDSMLMVLVHAEYIFVEAKDRLVHLHISSGTLDWEAKRYVREPFGDYTVTYQPLGRGIGLTSLQEFLKNRLTT